MSADDPICPVVETEDQAVALGKALAVVWHYEADWTRRVFKGNPILQYNTGPDVLNREIASRWEQYSTPDERRRIMAIYVAERLGR